MLMSIFSSFDALSAEYLGREVVYSPPSTSIKQDASVKIDDLKKVKIEDLKKDKEVNSSSRPAKDRRSANRLRFAPELDGVNCFETILPY